MKGMIKIVLAVIALIGAIIWFSWLTSRVNSLKNNADKQYMLMLNENEENLKIHADNLKMIEALNTRLNTNAVSDVDNFANRNKKDFYTKCKDNADCGEGRFCTDSGCTVYCQVDEECADTMPSSVFGMKAKCVNSKCAPVVSDSPIPEMKAKFPPQQTKPQIMCVDDEKIGGCLTNCPGVGWDGMSAQDRRCIYRSPHPN